MWDDDDVRKHDKLLLVSRHFVDNPALLLVNNKAELFTDGMLIKKLLIHKLLKILILSLVNLK